MSRYNPHFPGADLVLRSAQTFARHCLLEQRSLFLPEDHPLSGLVWQSKTFDELVERYVDRPDVGEGTFVEKLAVQLSGVSPQSIALMSEIAWIVYLAVTNLGHNNKRERLARIWSMAGDGLPAFPVGIEPLSDDVLSALGSGGQGFNNYLWRELVFAIRGLREFIRFAISERERYLRDAWAFAGWLDGAPGAEGRQFYHCFCHLLFPDQFERMFSNRHKTRVLRAFSRWRARFDSDRSAQDQELLALRRHHELEYGVDIDYYTPPLRDLVDLSTEKAKKGVIKAGAASEVAGADDPFEDNPSTPESPVEPARNVVYYGPPGTGKTRKLENLRQHAYARGDYFMFVTFHPSYSYEDFIVGLRPVIVEGVVAVEVKHGPFIELCIKAHADPSRRFVLFIDEINRANVSKVFGEVISLVEPGRRVPPGSTGNQDHLSVTLPLLDKPLSVPNNIDIYASMNSADRSLVHLDTALRRRFEFVEIAPDAAAVEPGMVDGVDLRALLTRLNERLEWLLDRDHLIGHALLMGIDSMDRLRAVFRTSIIPLLEEYFYEDRGRVGLALMGKSNAKPFIERRSLNPGVLFADTDIASESAKDVFIVGDPASWAVEDFQRIYAAPAVSGSTG